MVGTGIGAGATGIETHVGRAVPEVLEEAIRTGAQVRITSFVLNRETHWKQRETGETIVTTIGGTLIDGTEMIVGGTRGGMTATATGTTLGIEICHQTPKPSLPQG